MFSKAVHSKEYCNNDQHFISSSRHTKYHNVTHNKKENTWNVNVFDLKHKESKSVYNYFGKQTAHYSPEALEKMGGKRD